MNGRKYLGTRIAARVVIKMSPANPLIRSADVALIEAEVQFRLDNELKQVRVEAERLRAKEIARAETTALEREARAIARVSAQAEEQHLSDIARIEGEAAIRLERAVAEARAAGEAAASKVLREEIDRAHQEGDAAAAQARELEADLTRARADAEADRDAAIRAERLTSEALRRVEAELARVKAEADARARVTPQPEARDEDAGTAERDHPPTDVACIEAEVEGTVKPWLEQVRAGTERLRIVDAVIMEAVAARGQMTEDRTSSSFARKIGEIMESAAPAQ